MAIRIPNPVNAAEVHNSSAAGVLANRRNRQQIEQSTAFQPGAMQAQRIDNDRKQQELARYTDENNMRSMTKGALEFLQIDPNDVSAQNRFIQNRAREIAQRGGDPQDTLSLGSLPPAQRYEAAKAHLQIAQQMGFLQQPQQPKPPSSVQEYERAKSEGYEGTLEDWVSGKAKSGATKMTVNTGVPAATPFEKKVDEKAADVVLDWTTGGRSRALQNVSEFTRIKDELKSGRINTRTIGDFTPLISDNIRKLFNEPAAEAVNDIRAIAFQVLRETLGAQFTEKEGERLMATYFDPQLSEEANIKRMERLSNLSEQMAEDKDRLAQYMQKNRTAVGFKYIIDDPMQELRELVNEADQPEAVQMPEGMDPQDWEFMTPEERELFK